MKGSSEHSGQPAAAPTPSTDALHGRLRRFRSEEEDYRWEDVPLKRYKNEGSHFRDVTRQTLFTEEDGQPCELRYFEIEPAGHSTFERHDHPHSVVILRGRGRVIVGDEVADVGTFDLLHIPSRTWHQLQADEDEPLGFLCQVPCDRDRPSRPTAEERKAILTHSRIGPIARL
ncbi:MAG: cupin domain-containing protein [Rhodothermales bacterium]